MAVKDPTPQRQGASGDRPPQSYPTQRSRKPKTTLPLSSLVKSHHWAQPPRKFAALLAARDPVGRNLNLPPLPGEKLLSKLLFFLVSPAGSSVPGETAAEEGGSGVAVSGETSVGPSPSAAVEGGSCSVDSDSSAILLSRRRGRKWWLSVFRGRGLRQGASLKRLRCGGRGNSTQR